MAIKVAANDPVGVVREVKSPKDAVGRAQFAGCRRIGGGDIERALNAICPPALKHDRNEVAGRTVLLLVHYGQGVPSFVY